MALTEKTLIRCGVPAELARAHLPHMARAMSSHAITTRPRGRAFLATVLHESMGLRAMSEIGGGHKYEGRGGLGNSHRGDGDRFKGRGPIQLTGRSNYAYYGRLLGLDLVSHPELVATPEVGWKVAACFFQKHAGVLAAADAGDFRRVTRLVNGGYNGWEDRERYWKRLATLGVVPGAPSLKRGTRGHEVEALTRRLSRVRSKKTGKPYLRAARARFDLRTARAVRAFQRDQGLKVDGVLGPHTAAVLRRAAKPPTPAEPRAMTRAGTAIVNHEQGGNGSDRRVTRLWQRLEQLDREGDRVRHELHTASPPGPQRAEGLSDVQLVEALERADADSDAMRKALAARLAGAQAAAQTPDALGELARELTALGARLAELAAHRPAPAPAQPASQDAIAHLEALEEEATAVRGALESELLASQHAGPAGAPPSGPANPQTSRYLELLATLDTLDCEADKIRAALRGGRAREQARTFRMRSPAIHGEDVRRWQVFVNRCLHRWGVDHEVDVDGEYGAETAHWSKRVLYGLGISTAGWDGLKPESRIKARHPQTRTPAEIATARKRRGWHAQLRHDHSGPKHGKKAALAYSKKHAERGTHETRVNGGPFIDDWCRMVHLTPGTEGAHWCGAFVNACLVEGGQPSRDWLRYTPSIVNNAKAGVDGFSWHTRPRAGDLVLFNWPGGEWVDHVGLVVEVNANGSVKTVEGNFKDRVGYWQRKSNILGFARPPWR